MGRRGARSPLDVRGGRRHRVLHDRAAFADVLRNGQDAEHWSLAQIRDLARAASGSDPDRRELVGLIDRAIELRGSERQAVRPSIAVDR